MNCLKLDDTGSIMSHDLGRLRVDHWYRIIIGLVQTTRRNTKERVASEHKTTKSSHFTSNLYHLHPHFSSPSYRHLVVAMGGLWLLHWRDEENHAAAARMYQHRPFGLLMVIAATRGGSAHKYTLCTQSSSFLFHFSGLLLVSISNLCTNVFDL
jgi:hypothetical protein